MPLEPVPEFDPMICFTLPPPGAPRSILISSSDADAIADKSSLVASLRDELAELKKGQQDDVRAFEKVAKVRDQHWDSYQKERTEHQKTRLALEQATKEINLHHDEAVQYRCQRDEARAELAKTHEKLAEAQKLNHIARDEFRRWLVQEVVRVGPYRHTPEKAFFMAAAHQAQSALVKIWADYSRTPGALTLEQLNPEIREAVIAARAAFPPAPPTE